jgi:hypothetical protein
MPLENSDVIDLITSPAPNAIALLITDSGTTSDPSERLALLKRKFETYVAYVADPRFAERHPGVDRNRVTIVVVCRLPPTPAMKAIAGVTTKDPPLTLPVVYDMLDF